MRFWCGVCVSTVCAPVYCLYGVCVTSVLSVVCEHEGVEYGVRA